MDELNRRGKEFVNSWCNDVHTTTQRIPNEHYLLEEKPVLQKLPETRYRMSPLSRRKVSADSFVSIKSNKYSVPVKYVGKTVFVRIVYGFRIEIYEKGEKLILTVETSYGKKEIIKDDAHYEAIAKKVPTSIPQIRRDFSSLFTNGEKYLLACGKKYDQPTHYARKIMELRELYDDDVLDQMIELSVRLDCMDIRSFKALLKSYNSGLLDLYNAGSEAVVEDLTRDLDYYEKAITEEHT